MSKNQLPVAMAGPDQVLTFPTDSIALDGSLSSDPDGAIRSWRWAKVSGPASAAIAKSSDSVTIARALTVGVYKFELVVTDNAGATDADTVQITVQESLVQQRPPVAHAGNDTTILLPASTVILDGTLSSDPDNNINGYNWSRISGPSNPTILNANTVRTQTNNLVVGIYQFELLVTDATGLSDRDTMMVTVEQVIEVSPCTDCRIVFVSNRDGNDDIYSCKADGSDIRQLTNDPASDSEPVWSPGGSKIAFTSMRSGHQELYTMNADGSNVQRKTFDTIHPIWSPTWSPDGRHLAYATTKGGSLRIWIIDAVLPGGSPVLLKDLKGWNGNPSWSPDGKKIAFTSDYQAYGFVYDIFTIDIDGTSLVNLTNRSIFDRIDYAQPRWSPDGTKLALLIIDQAGPTRVATMNPDGSVLTSIVSGAQLWTKLSWSPDGARILYTMLNGTTRSIAWVSSDGATKGTLFSNGWDADWMH